LQGVSGATITVQSPTGETYVTTAVGPTASGSITNLEPNIYTITIEADSHITTVSPTPVVVDQNIVTTTQVTPIYGTCYTLFSINHVDGTTTVVTLQPTTSGGYFTSVDTSAVVDTTAALLTITPSTFSLSALMNGSYPQIVFLVSNIGQQVASEVHFQVPSIPNIVYFGVDTPIGEIKPGETKWITLDVITNYYGVNKR
jgi:hypothetical protein